MGVIQAYSYPLCSEYFPGYTDLIEDVYTIEIECNVLSTNRRLGVEKGNNDKESESVNTDDILFSLSNDEIVVAMMPFNVSSCQGGAITEIEIKHERNIEQCAATELLVAATSTELASTEVASITITINKAKGGKSYRYDGMETLVPDSTPEDELNNTTNLIGFEFGSDTELSCNSTIQGPKTPEGVQGGGPDYALNGEECSALKICEWGMSCLVNGRCTDGQHGSECIIDGDCEKGRCVGELLETGTCEALLPIGSSCSLASSCETDICHEGKCAEPAKLGEECWAWIPCANALECMAVVQKCSDRKNGSPCALRAQCESNACLDNTCVPLALNGEFCGPERVCDAGLACLAFQQKCTNGNIGSPCVLPSDCDAPACINNKCAALAKNGESCGAGLQCEYGLACLAIQQKCTNGNIGSPCVLPSDCDVPACIKNKCAALAKNGESCGAGLQCESGLACLAFQQKCTNGSDGSFCNVDADCNSGRCASGKCGPKVGSCGSCGSGSHCISGKCYLRSTKMVCAESDGKMANDCYCDLDSHCQSGRCEGSWPPYQCHSKLGDGSGCDENSDCTSGLCASGKCTTYAYNGQSCWAGRPCASGLACLAFHQKCTDGRSGSLCNAAWDCDSGWCWASKCD